MKRFLSILSLMLLVIFTTPEIEAKKFGGGKSMGKSYKTAPAPSASPTNAGSVNKQSDRNNQSAQAPANGSTKKGLMGGLLGGLLAGGLLAALFAGGSFEGFQFADFLIIGVLAFTVFIIIRAMKAKKNLQNQSSQFATAGAFENSPNDKRYYHERSQYQPHTGYREETSRSSSGFSNDVPLNYPPHFDTPAFLHGAREHYRILQEAWNKNKLATIQEYVSVELYHELARDRAELVGDQHTEVMYVDAQIVRADYNNERAELSLQFSGRYRDVKEGIEEDIKDIWHLERSLIEPNAPWLIVGIQG